MPELGRPLEDVEISLLSDGIFRIYGFDFRCYSLPFLRKRLRSFCLQQRIESISALQDRVLHDADYLQKLVDSITITQGIMFKDPPFYKCLRDNILSLLPEQGLLRIWQCGCSTGQELYSLIITLIELGLYERCRIYATDSNASALKQAKSRVLPIGAMKQYTENYVKSGGTQAFSEYYTATEESVILSPLLSRNVIFGKFDISRENPFNEFQLIMTKNQIFSLKPAFRRHTLRIVHRCLIPGGIVGFGRSEPLKDCSFKREYEVLNQELNLYRKKQNSAYKN